LLLSVLDGEGDADGDGLAVLELFAGSVTQPAAVMISSVTIRLRLRLQIIFMVFIPLCSE
jgi:hypothetical protein